MAAITKITRKTGVSHRVTINMAGVRPFSRSFKTKSNARAWAKKTEGGLEVARVEGNNLARNLTLAALITELFNSRPLNQATVIALTWWKENYGYMLSLLLDKSIIREALQGLAEGPVVNLHPNMTHHLHRKISHQNSCKYLVIE